MFITGPDVIRPSPARKSLEELGGAAATSRSGVAHFAAADEDVPQTPAT